MKKIQPAGKAQTKPARRSRKVVAKASTTRRPSKEKVGKTEPEFPAYDEEAWKWMAEQSIPGAYSPIMYIGVEVSHQIAAILGRPMTLEEAQYLVKIDGDFVKCAYTGTEFQPVEYVFRVPPGLKDKIAAGAKLTEVELVTGGAFYFNKGKGEMMPLSGSVFEYDRRAQAYRWCMSSPLVIAANEARKITGHMKWGAPSHQIGKIMNARQENRERHEKIAGLMAEVFAPRRDSRFGIGKEAQGELGKLKLRHRNGRRQRHHEVTED